MYGKEDGSVPATFQIIFMVRPLYPLSILLRPLCTCVLWTQEQKSEKEAFANSQIGWKPGPNAPKPLERGSAQTNLKDILS